MPYDISTLRDTGLPVGDHDLLQRVVLLVCLIKFNINKFCCVIYYVPSIHNIHQDKIQ
jgi:hypothetical protein